MRYIGTENDITIEVWHAWRARWLERSTRAVQPDPVLYVTWPSEKYVTIAWMNERFGRPIAQDNDRIAWLHNDVMISGTLETGENDHADAWTTPFADINQPRMEAPDLCGAWESATYIRSIIDDGLRDSPACKPMPERRGMAVMMVATRSGPEFRAVGKLGCDLVRENYTPATLAGFDSIVRSMRAESPMGRLSILNGPPGSGKTRMVRGMLKEVNECVHVLIPTKEIAALADPTMLTALLNLQDQGAGQRIVLYLEDADQALAVRDGDSMPVISTLLQATDGMLGALLNLYVVATTNQDLSNIDDAVKRPGRLDVQMEIGPLDANQATSVLARLVPNTTMQYQRSKTLAEIYVDAAKMIKELSL